MTETQLVELVVDDKVAIIKMVRPPANALSYELIAELDEALTNALSAGAAAIVFSSGLDKFFAAGADLKLLAEATSADFGRYLLTLRTFIERIPALPLPSIAAMHGMALGGGLELALACTLRTASPEAQLGLPEVKLGLLPGAGGTQRLSRLVGRAVALDLLLTGRSVDGQRALEIGLVDHLYPVDQLTTQTVDFARSLANGPKQAIAAIIRSVDASGDGPLIDGMAIESDLVQALFSTQDAREGITAFIEKRKPIFE